MLILLARNTNLSLGHLFVFPVRNMSVISVCLEGEGGVSLMIPNIRDHLKETKLPTEPTERGRS